MTEAFFDPTRGKPEPGQRNYFLNEDRAHVWDGEVWCPDPPYSEEG